MPERKSIKNVDFVKSVSNTISSSTIQKGEEKVREGAFKNVPPVDDKILEKAKQKTALNNEPIKVKLSNGWTILFKPPSFITSRGMVETQAFLLYTKQLYSAGIISGNVSNDTILSLWSALKEETKAFYYNLAFFKLYVSEILDENDTPMLASNRITLDDFINQLLADDTLYQEVVTGFLSQIS